MKTNLINAALFAFFTATCSSFAGNLNDLLWQDQFDNALETIKNNPDAIQFVDENGNSPLHIACQKGQKTVVIALLKQGADIQHRDNAQRTVLVKAIWANNPEIAQILLKKGVSVDATDQWQNSPLHHASFSQSLEIAELLLANGADVNATNQSKMTPLMAALFRGNGEIASLYMSNGAEVNCKDDDDQTPLIMAAKRGMTDTVTTLLKRGADPNQSDKQYGRTAMHYAAIAGYNSLVKQFASVMDNVDVEDQHNLTPEAYLSKYSKPQTMNTAVEIADAGVGNLAQVYYTGHSGWVVKTANNVLVFDYWKPNVQADNPSIYNGYLTKEDTDGKPVTAFTSHDHGDHYDTKALKSLKGTSDKVQYVYGFNPKAKWRLKSESKKANKTQCCEQDAKSRSENTGLLAMKPNTEKTLDDMKITTIRSIDTGVGFLVEVDGVSIFHAGDHANLNKADSETYEKEIAFLEAKGVMVDIAFLPVSGCPSRWKKDAVVAGFFETAKRLYAKTVVPMHAGGREQEYLEFAKMAKERGSPFAVQCVENPGDHFTYSNPSTLVASNE